jgi:ABC-type molybdate transport system substrate-binding protein
VRPLIRFLALAAAVATPFASVAAQTARPVTVLYAGSLVTPMEGPVKASLATAGIDFQGEGGGSKMLANLIASGAKNPDAFVSVDPKLITGLGDRVAYAVTFASTSLGVGWSNQSRFAALFDAVAAGKTPLLAALATRGLAIGRTDPKLDPKGEYTIEAMTVLAGKDGERKILGDDENQAQTFPEEDLLVRIETGQADAGFFYKTEAVARGLSFVPLPGAASLSERITYTLAIMRGAPHPQAAAAFRDFVLRGAGKRILEQAGLTYLAAPKTLVSAPVWAPRQDDGKIGR